MEMEKIVKEPDSGEGTSGTKAKTEEEAEAEIYSKLNSPSEDLYADAKFFSDPSKKKKVLQSERFWKVGCFCLGVVCVILLLAVVVLVLKLQQEAVCKVSASKPQYEKSPPASHKIPVAATAPCLAGCQSSVCDAGWVYSSRSCFLLTSGRKNWEESRTDCEKKGGSLAVITDTSLQTFLTNKSTVEYWIGLSQKGSVWTWVNGQTLTRNSFWSESNPGTGNCAMLIGDRIDKNEKNWGKSLCERPKYYICQKPMNN